ncbi:MAG: cyclic nucleotide-binding domain-containing protein [Burkholderiaceae bacterium]|jgi:rhodanese-related sulfurtransferase
MKSPSVATLSHLDPLCALSPDRLAELSSFCRTEAIPEDADPFDANEGDGYSVYVLHGAIEVTYQDGEREVVSDTASSGRRPIGKGRRVLKARALTPTELMRIDDDLIDIMVTWNQIETLGEMGLPQSGSEGAPRHDRRGGWTQFIGVFSLDTLCSGAFASLPPAHIAELLRRFATLEVRRGDVIVQEGDPGDYYYVIESGRARVTRLVGGTSMPLADLKSGDAFGEEALLMSGRRNATVTMRTDGRLLRLAKEDFDTLLKRPLLTEIEYAQAQLKVAQGAQWVDVRFPSEYQHDRIPGAINVPLGELRDALDLLDKDVEYVTYCQSGRRSAAAAFLLAQRGYRAAVLAGGIWSKNTSV